MAREPENVQKLDAVSHAERTRIFEAAVLVHLNSAYTVARYLARRDDVADDLVQEALLRAYRSFDESRCSNVRAWLLAIVRNCFLTWKARNQEQTVQFDLEGTSIPSADGIGCDREQETPEFILIHTEDAHAVRSLIESLPHPFREVLVLRDIADMSYREIADITDVPIGTVMSRLARARKMFAAAWNGSQLKSSKEMLL